MVNESEGVKLFLENKLKEVESFFQENLGLEGLLVLTEEEKRSLNEEIQQYKDKIAKIDGLEEKIEEELREAEERRIITLLIPVEKLATAQRDIKKFLANWNKDKLDKIKSLSILRKYKLSIGTVQWAGRVSSVVGGSLLLVGTQNGNEYYTTAGGVIAIVSPFIEVVAFQLEKNVYENNREKWREFTQASDRLLDTYWELDEILKKIPEEPIKGEVKIALRNLKEKIHNFLEEYDKNKDGKIDEEEWEIAKKQFTQDLKNNWSERKSQIKEIQETTEKLEQEVSGYRQQLTTNLTEENKKEKVKQSKIINQLQTQIEVIEIDNRQTETHHTIDLDKHFEEKELIAQQEKPPK